MDFKKKIFLILLGLVAVSPVFYLLRPGYGPAPIYTLPQRDQTLEQNFNATNIQTGRPEQNVNQRIVTQPKPQYKEATTTLFWVGEESNAENDFIANHESYFDSFWLEHYGGIDSPAPRCGFLPCAFLPRENPFYFALPYGERDEEGNLKSSVERIPWYRPISLADNQSLLKNVWIEIRYGDRVCYAQWQDVGPFETDDFDYVFGASPPKNTFGVSAGLDISPATWDCLGLKTNDVTAWRFVPDSQVPPGPWKAIVTRRGLSF